MKQKNRFRGWLLPKRKETDTIPVIPFETYPRPTFQKIWKEYRWTIIIVLIVLIILFTNIMSYGQSVKPGDRLPDLRFEPLTGYEHPGARLSDFKGKVVIRCTSYEQGGTTEKTGRKGSDSPDRKRTDPGSASPSYGQRSADHSAAGNCQNQSYSYISSRSRRRPGGQFT